MEAIKRCSWGGNERRSSCGAAEIRAHKAAPQLHSIFDIAQLSNVFFL